MNVPVKRPRPYSLYDFRMQDVSYEIVTLGQVRIYRVVPVLPGIFTMS